MADFYDTLNTGISTYLPLAVKMDELKRKQHLDNALKFLDMVDLPNAITSFKAGGMPDVNVESLTQSPKAQDILMNLAEKKRAFEAKEAITSDVEKVLAGTTEERPAYRDSWMPQNVPTPTEKVNVPGVMTPEKLFEIGVKRDPTGQLVQKLGTLLPILEMKIQHHKDLKEAGKRREDLTLLLANMTDQRARDLFLARLAAGAGTRETATEDKERLSELADLRKTRRALIMRRSNLVPELSEDHKKQYDEINQEISQIDADLKSLSTTEKSPKVGKSLLAGKPAGYYMVNGKKVKWDGAKEIP